MNKNHDIQRNSLLKQIQKKIEYYNSKVNSSAQVALYQKPPVECVITNISDYITCEAQFNSLLQKIQKEIELYNSQINPGEQIELYKKQLVKPVIPNTSDYVICLVKPIDTNGEDSEPQVQLFEKKWFCNQADATGLTSVYVYIGVNSNLVGVSAQVPGSDIEIVSETSFEKMRSMASTDEKIGPYVVGIVRTNDDLEQVLAYAKDYYACQDKERKGFQKQKSNNSTMN